MRAPTHMTTGGTTAAYVTTGLAVCGVPYGVALMGGACTLVGSIAPDIDHHGSQITNMPAPRFPYGMRRSSFGRFLIGVILLGTFLLRCLTMCLSWVIRGAPVHLGFFDGYLLPWTRCEHRGFTHRPEGWLTFALVFAVGGGLLVGYPLVWGVSMFLGCATHTWGDCRTVAGVALVKGGEPTRIGETFRVERGDYDDDGYLTEEARLRRFVYTPVCAISWAGCLWAAWVLHLM